MHDRSHPIASEGYPFIILSAFVTLVLALLGWTLATLVLLALTLFIVYFFRNPERTVPRGEGLVVAPADGRIVFLDRVEDAPKMDGPALKVSIFMSVFNVHVNRFPCTGTVVDSWYKKGAFVNAALDKASERNEQQGLLIDCGEKRKLVCVQVAGLIARRIVCYPRIGDQLATGERYGLIRFGSRVDVYLPIDFKVQVSLGQTTVAGETILGQWQ
ncbi:MAG: phosphatidylserine decarboxylase family protein [Deltaproteobacteria bacterium]|nr:MAG: phosphatidylserine decarboxylase family protein [Deltaproteobacteria bacterium]